MGATKPRFTTETKLKRIADLSAGTKEMGFHSLMHHFNEESLAECFQRLKGNRAVGIDGVTKEQYGENLDENIKEPPWSGVWHQRDRVVQATKV